jgi:hypothetical protein
LAKYVKREFKSAFSGLSASCAAIIALQVRPRETRRKGRERSITAGIEFESFQIVQAQLRCNPLRASDEVKELYRCRCAQRDFKAARGAG